MRFFGFWLFICTLLLQGLFKLLFDNILYGAIMAWLKLHFGIEESDVIAVVATNLIPILATIVVMAAIYWLALQHHLKKAGSADVVSAKNNSQPPTSTNRIAKLFSRIEPLPAIALGLTIALAGGVYWQLYHGPLNQLGQIAPPKQPLTPPEIAFRVQHIDQILSSLGVVKDSIAASRDILDNWQYQIQTNGPDDFMSHVATIYNNMAFGGFIGVRNAVNDIPNIPDIRDLGKQDAPDCVGKTRAFYDELKRIKDHKADMIFTLINDTKMADWRIVIPECEKWVNDRIAIAKRVRGNYAP